MFLLLLCYLDCKYTKCYLKITLLGEKCYFEVTLSFVFCYFEITFVEFKGIFT